MESHTDNGKTNDAYTMTAAQQRVLRAMDTSTSRINDALPASSGSLWQLSLGVAGVGLIVAGTVLVFFFAAAGAVMLGAGALSFYAALQSARFTRAAQPARPLVEQGSLEPPTAH